MCTLEKLIWVHRRLSAEENYKVQNAKKYALDRLNVVLKGNAEGAEKSMALRRFVLDSANCSEQRVLIRSAPRHCSVAQAIFNL